MMNRLRHVRYAGMILLFALSTPIVHGQVYKCKDDKGRTLYSGHPCEYDAKQIALPDNAVQGTRSQDSGYSGGSTSRSGSPGADAMARTSQECVTMQSELATWAAKPIPNDITSAAQQREKVAQLTKSYDLICGSGAMSARGVPQKSFAVPSKAECTQISYDLKTESARPVPADVTAGLRQRQRVKQLQDAYQAMGCASN